MQFISYNDWNDLPDSASELFSEGEKRSLFLSRQWLETLSENALKDGQSLLLACVIEGNEVRALMPFIRGADGSMTALSNQFSAHYSLLVNASEKEQTLSCLAQGLYEIPLRVFRLEPIDEDDANLQTLLNALAGHGYIFHRYFKLYNWIHRMDGQSYAEYISERPPILRNAIGRKQRKLEREHGCEIRLYTNEHVDQALTDYYAVYRESWKADEPFGRFLRVLVPRLADAYWLRFAVLYTNDKPIAGQIWFVVHGKAYIYRLVYDEQWGRYSPGSILTRYLMKHVIDIDQVKEIDYLTGNERYKQDWMSVRRERHGVYVELKPRNVGVLDKLKGLVGRFQRA